jgi:hypothetical protein
MASGPSYRSLAIPTLLRRKRKFNRGRCEILKELLILNIVFAIIAAAIYISSV